MEPSAHDLVFTYGQSSLVLDKRGQGKVNKLRVVIDQFLSDRARAFLLDRLGEPLLFWYASDCTPIRHREIHRRRWAQYSVRRSGQNTVEFLIQRMFLVDTKLNVSTYFSEPLALSDKTVSTHFQAFLDHFAAPREWGHTSISSCWFVWGRAVQLPMERLMRKYFITLRAKWNASLPLGRARAQYLRTRFSSSGASATTYTTHFVGGPLPTSSHAAPSGARLSCWKV